MAEQMKKWRPWDENNPPPPGEYIVWHPNFRIPGEKVWTFRASGNNKFLGPDKVRWSYKKGQCVWFNEGNWQADGAPTHYCPMPRFSDTQPAAVDAITGWLPIDKAPKDGTCIFTCIIAGSDVYDVCVNHWNNPRGTGYALGREGWWASRPHLQPTHYMLVPKASQVLTP